MKWLQPVLVCMCSLWLMSCGIFEGCEEQIARSFSLLGWLPNNQLLILYNNYRKDLRPFYSSKDKSDNTNIFLYSVGAEGSNFKSVVDFRQIFPENTHILMISSDRKSLIVEKITDTEEKKPDTFIYLLSLEDFTYKLLLNEKSYISPKSLSQKNRYLIYQNNTFFILDIETGQKIPIKFISISEKNILISDVQWTPKLSRIWFTYSILDKTNPSYVKAYGDINLVTGEVSNIKILYQIRLNSNDKENFEFSFAGWKDEDTMIYLFSQIQEKTKKIYTHNLETNEIKNISTIPENNSYYYTGLSSFGLQGVHFSPDFTKVAYINQTFPSSLKVTNIDNTNTKELLNIFKFPKGGRDLSCGSDSPKPKYWFF